MSSLSGEEEESRRGPMFSVTGERGEKREAGRPLKEGSVRVEPGLVKGRPPSAYSRVREEKGEDEGGRRGDVFATKREGNGRFSHQVGKRDPQKKELL